MRQPFFILQAKVLVKLLTLLRGCFQDMHNLTAQIVISFWLEEKRKGWNDEGLKSLTRAH